VTPGSKVIWGKEIGLLKALTSTPPAVKSEEDLQCLVDEIGSAVGVKERDDEAKSRRGGYNYLRDFRKYSNYGFDSSYYLDDYLE
jgi:hypothetical protein